MPAAAAEPIACGRGNAVGLTSILDRGQFFPVHTSARTPSYKCKYDVLNVVEKRYAWNATPLLHR